MGDESVTGISPRHDVVVQNRQPSNVRRMDSYPSVPSYSIKELRPRHVAEISSQSHGKLKQSLNRAEIYFIRQKR